MEVIGRVGIQATQFQVGKRETGATLGHRGKNTGVGAVAGCTGQLIAVLHIQQAVLLRSADGYGRNTAVESQLHFCFDVIGSTK